MSVKVNFPNEEVLEQRIATFNNGKKSSTYAPEEVEQFVQDIKALYDQGAGHIAFRGLLHFCILDDMGAREGLPPNLSTALRAAGLKDENFIKLVCAIGESHTESLGIESVRESVIRKAFNWAVAQPFRMAQYPQSSFVSKSVQSLASMVGLGGFLSRLSEKARMLFIEDFCEDEGVKFEHGFWETGFFADELDCQNAIQVIPS